MMCFYGLHHGATGLQKWSTGAVAKARTLLASSLEAYHVPVCPVPLRLEATLHSILKQYGDLARDVPFGPVLLAQMFGMGFYVSGTTSNCRIDIDATDTVVVDCVPSSAAGTLLVHISGCRLQDPTFPTDAALSSLLSAILQFAPDSDKQQVATGEAWVLGKLRDVFDALLVSPPEEASIQGPNFRFQSMLRADRAGGVFAGLSTFVPDSRTNSAARYIGHWVVTYSLDVPQKLESQSHAIAIDAGSSSSSCSYSLEVLTLWADLSPTGEPSASERILQKGSRINEGSSISLSAIGNRPRHIQLRSRLRYNYGGLVVQSPGTKSVYFVDQNQVTRVLKSWEQLVDILGKIDQAVNVTAHARHAEAVIQLVKERSKLDAAQRIYKMNIPLFRSFVEGPVLDDVDGSALIAALWKDVDGSGDANTNTRPRRVPLLLSPSVADAFPAADPVNLLTAFKDFVKLPVLLWSTSASKVKVSQKVVIKFRTAKAATADANGGLPLCSKHVHGTWQHASECVVGTQAAAEMKTNTFLGYHPVIEHSRNAKYWLASNYSNHMFYTYVNSNTLVDTIGSRCRHTQSPHSPCSGQVECNRPNKMYAQSDHLYQVLGLKSEGASLSLTASAEAANQEALLFAEKSEPHFNRPDGAVFVASGCRLIEFLTNRPVTISLQKSVSNSGVQRAIYSLKSSRSDAAKAHCDSMSSLASATSPLPPPRLLLPKTAAPAPVEVTVRIPSLAAFSLFSAGVGLLSGFGDSLGDEQLDNSTDLFDQVIGTAYEAAAAAKTRAAVGTSAGAGTGTGGGKVQVRSKRHFMRDFAIKADSDFHGVGIDCVGSATNKIHNLAPKWRANTAHFPLIECIENAVEQLFDGPGKGHMETPVYHANDATATLGNATHPAKAIWIRQKIRKIVTGM